jgi:putative transcriptional regulator
MYGGQPYILVYFGSKGALSALPPPAFLKAQSRYLARPMTPSELASAQRVPRAKTLRRALGLTQDEFALRYQIPIGTLRDWEQGRTEPDQPARAYLKVIARDPERVRVILSTGPKRI